MERKLLLSIQQIAKTGKGFVAVIGDSFTGKTYTVNKIIQQLKLNTISIDFESICQNWNTTDLKKLVTNKSKKIEQFYSNKKQTIYKEIVFCDALESYNTSMLTFLKKVSEYLPVIATCDRSVVIPNAIDRIWWSTKKYTPESWEGDSILQTPRDLLTSLTQRRTKIERAISNFSSDSFLLTQYYHDEFPGYKNNTLETIVHSTNALSTMDYIRGKEWASNGLMSTSHANDELFVRTIRKLHRNPCLIPIGWFPKTLSKQSQITKKTQELSVIKHTLPYIDEIISYYSFKIGKSFAYKTNAKNILYTSNPELYSRALELTGNTTLTVNEIKKLSNK